MPVRNEVTSCKEGVQGVVGKWLFWEKVPGFLSESCCFLQNVCLHMADLAMSTLTELECDTLHPFSPNLKRCNFCSEDKIQEARRSC